MRGLLGSARGPGRAEPRVGGGHQHPVLLQFNPSQQLSIGQPLAHSPPMGWGRESKPGETHGSR